MNRFEKELRDKIKSELPEKGWYVTKVELDFIYYKSTWSGKDERKIPLRNGNSNGISENWIVERATLEYAYDIGMNIYFTLIVRHKKGERVSYIVHEPFEVDVVSELRQLKIDYILMYI